MFLLSKLPIAHLIPCVLSLLTSLSPSYCHCKGAELEPLTVPLAVKMGIATNYRQELVLRASTSGRQHWWGGGS